MTIRSVLFIAVLGMLVGCNSGVKEDAKEGAKATPNVPPPHDLERVFGSQSAIAIVKSATQVRAYRLDPGRLEPEQVMPDAGQSLSESDVIALPIEVSPLQVNSLRQVLLDPSTYEWDISKACIPFSGIRLQFATGHETVDIKFCMECDMLSIWENGKVQELKRGLGDREFDFDHGRARLVSLFKEIFPEDKVIQSLTEKRMPLSAR